MTVCRDPDTGMLNVGIYRHEVKGKDKLACMMVPFHHGAEIARRYAELGKPMEVVTFIGHHPAVAMAADNFGTTAKIKELEFMGALLGEPLEVTPAVTVDLPVPAFAEIAIEGVIDPTKMDTEGPFSEGGGYYGEGNPCYIIQVTAITMRHDAIYHDLHPTHQEHLLVGLLGRESLVYDRIRSEFPSVKAVHMGPEGIAGRILLYLSIKKRSEDDSRLAGLAALNATGLGKITVVVDEDINVYDEREVLWAIATRVRECSVVTTNLSANAFPMGPTKSDSAGVDLRSRGTKILLDATQPVGKPSRIKVTLPRELWESMRLEDYLK
jgi:2,5-furandicarboxylate decarboxylase 1